LTGISPLPDHLSLLTELDGRLGRLDGQGGMGLALLSLDCLARIDGMLGYLAGDVLCDQIAGLLRQVLKPGDCVYRVGRGELACVLSKMSSTGHAVLAATRILRVLEARLSVEGAFIRATPRVGVAIGESGDDGNTLLRRANVAMHEARRSYEHYAVYERRLDEPNQIQFQLQSALREAIEDNSLAVSFQPKLHLGTNTITSVETLVRWSHAAQGDIPPSHFIPVAEASGFISELTLRVLNAALCGYATMSAEVENIQVAVNVSAKDLQERHLPEVIQQLLGTWNVPAARLTLELTETAMLEDEAVYVDALSRLKETGVRLSIDDFGTGYSSMSRLRFLPLDEIKLDISFVRDMLASPRDERIVGSMIALAHDLGLSVVAEGVEDGATLQRLREYGCDLVQGYWVSKPLSLDELVAFLRGWTGEQEIR